MAAAVDTEVKKKGPSLVVQLGLLIGLSVLAAGIGWLTGGRLAPGAKVQTVAKTASQETKGHGEDEAEEPEVTQGAANVVALDPMTTNLAAPTSVWVRLELSLVFDGPADADIAEKIHQDLFAFLRTVKLDQISSASGFQHLKTDLNERARLRSDGHVKDVLVRSLIFE